MSDRQLLESIAKNITSLKSRVTKLEKRVAKLEKQPHSCYVPAVAADANSEDMYQEMLERQRRAKNIMIEGITEPQISANVADDDPTTTQTLSVKQKIE